jgi:hypothetical protein
MERKLFLVNACRVDLAACLKKVSRACSNLVLILHSHMYVYMCLFTVNIKKLYIIALFIGIL